MARTWARIRSARVSADSLVAPAEAGAAGPLHVDLRPVGPVAEADAAIGRVVHDRAHGLVGVRLGHGEELHQPEGGGGPDAGGDAGEDELLRQPPVLHRDAGEGHQLPPAEPHREARRRAEAVRDHGRAAREAGLLGVVRGHLPPELPEALPDGLERGLVQLERNAHGRRHHLGGEVVLGGAEAAAHHDEVGAGGGLVQRGGEVVPVVGHERLAARHDAQVPEPVHEPDRVGVEDLPGEELVAGGEQLDVKGGGVGHGVSSMHHQWMSPVQPRRRVSPSWRKASAKPA